MCKELQQLLYEMVVDLRWLKHTSYYTEWTIHFLPTIIFYWNMTYVLWNDGWFPIHILQLYPVLSDEPLFFFVSADMSSRETMGTEARSFAMQ